MDKKALAMVLITIIFLLLGFVISYFFPIQTLYKEMPFSIVTISFFLGGVIYFGYLGFIPGILFGLQMGAEKNAAIFLYLIPLILATYAGTKMGFMLKEDINKKKNFMVYGKRIFLYIFSSLILSLIIELTLPLIIEYWPKDFLGLNMNKGKGIAGLIQELGKRTRR